ncbi:MAG TPA: DUF3180 domain-containing protein [Streptosporangiaceae bacterium]|jgi:hypothetical protein
MGPTRIRWLVVVFAVIAVATAAVLKGVYSTLPPLPWSAVPTLLLIAVAEVYLGLNFRARIQRKPHTRPVEPLVVARVVALAKATAYAGSGFAGIFAGFAVIAAGLLDKPAPRQDAIVAGGTLLAALVVVGAALFCEYCCRVPPGEDDKDGTPAAPDTDPFHNS